VYKTLGLLRMGTLVVVDDLYLFLSLCSKMIPLGIQMGTTIPNGILKHGAFIEISPDHSLPCLLTSITPNPSSTEFDQRGPLSQ